MMLRTFLLTALTISGVLATQPAQAFVVDFSGSNVNMGNLQVGQTGTITDIDFDTFPLPPDVVSVGVIQGALPRLSKIRFFYTFTGIESGATSSSISYDYFKDGNHYSGSSIGNSLDGNITSGYKNGAPVLSQVWAYSFFTAGLNDTATAKTVIANYSGPFQSFESRFAGIFDTQHSGVVTYTVSSIPLPASLPMMILALGGLFTLARRTNRESLLCASIA